MKQLFNYFGIQGLKVGLSVYTGKTQSTLFDGLDKSNDAQKAMADSLQEPPWQKKTPG
ncbi:MAG: hypothetical protein ACOCV9_02390 [Marinilabiliaceae bacterium]